MFTRIIAWILLIFGLFTKNPDFDILEAEKCKQYQGRPEMGKAYTYEIQLISEKKLRQVHFQYLLLDNEFIPLGDALSFEKINKNDTIGLHAIHYTKRPYKVDSSYVQNLPVKATAILFLYKNEPHFIKLDQIKDCNEEIDRR